MKPIERYAFLGALASACLIATACSSDEPTTNTGGGTGGKSDTGGSSGAGTGGKATGGGGANTGGGNTGGGNTGGGPTDGGGGTTGDAQTDGATGCDLSGTGKTKTDIPNPVTTNLTLTADKVWTVKDIVHVNSGATLTIEPCTRIEGTKNPIGVLVVTKGGKINAVGTKDEPILFTSQQPVGSRAAGDWGGVILLGQATNNDANDELIEGLADQPENHHGGTDDADDSGSMKYVRIEYAGFQLAPDVEVNGLTMGSVGSATQLSYIEVSHGLDDCFEWFGGTVNVDHIVCNADGDDIFDTDRGYRGTIDTAFGRKRTNPSADPNGFEWDNNKTNNANTPVTHPTAKNVTMCGFGQDVGTTTYGMVLRRGITGVIDNVVVVGFSYGIDLRDDVGTLAAPAITMTNTTFFDMLNPTPIANAAETDNDNGFDETAWFNAEPTNSTADPGFTTAQCNPPGDGAPPEAAVLTSGKGAFKDGASWLDGKWISWEDK